ncbi:unnamed protein product [Cylindrotheca closterium]|uniref:L-lactate permease n=1 Tax=Cylindrotheca closterium TaxID=2856 RepID=A0AAD2FN42_9STRA|nr:unnamed protein product [Cylindrotheca closterium]CAJ1970515.1 unnamed protein product [Cylindrotheca closterium]
MSNATEAAEGMSFAYSCQDPASVDACAATCVGLQACQACECSVIPLDVQGPWDVEALDVIFGLLPILLLIIVTVKPNPWPTSFSLPFAALCMFLVRTMYLAGDPLLAAACVLLGLLEALTPLSIIAGAMMLFETMESTYCLPYMMREMKVLTNGHPIAECMLIFSFATMVEGASGFGTPVALGAPMLVSTGNPKLESVVLLLVFNTFATVWGAVGTPIWFGFGGLKDLTEDDYLSISSKAAVAMGTGCLVLLPWVLTILLPWKLIRKNLLFIYLAIIGTMGPLLGVSFVSYEFPSLIGGLVGMGITGALISFKVGLKDLTQDDLELLEYHSDHRKGKDDVELANESEEIEEHAPTTNQNDEDVAAVGDTTSNKPDSVAIAGAEGIVGTKNREEAAVVSQQQALDDALGPRKGWGQGFLREVFARTFPVWGVVVLLILTRIKEIGLKEILTDQEPNFEIHFGTFGTFRLSASIVFQLKNILTYPNLSWKYEFIYLPFFLFSFISFLTFGLFRKKLSQTPKQVVLVVAGRLKNPAMALFGALVLVQLLIRGGTSSPAFVVGTILADWFQEGFVVITPLLGALGSFFSGSTTVSNLTFGDIQAIAAESIGVSTTAMLALQAVGGSAGNGICLNNIIAACTVVNLQVGEGQILARTARYVFALTTWATIIMLAFYFRF